MDYFFCAKDFYGNVKGESCYFVAKTENGMRDAFESFMNELCDSGHGNDTLIFTVDPV